MLHAISADDEQIRSLVLDKLRDPVVSDELKVAIVDFVCASITYQASIVRALFGGKESNTPPETTMSPYLDEYLQSLRDVIFLSF